MSTFHEFSASRLMPVPVAAVWDVASNPRRNAEWCNNVQGVTRADHSLEVGQSFEERSVVLGPWTSITTWTLLSSDHHRERRYTGKGFPGVSEVRPFLRFEPMLDVSGSEHTHVTYGSALAFRLKGLDRIVAGLLRGMLVAEFTTSLANLEQLAAHQAAASYKDGAA
ncbi:SRPBCC family protein [Strepomyces sp. STD 3.1]|uniref:SRPBCC family protein n=1 Tax=Streptomyces sp. NPDC058985 TaxID=3346684 RepID=UPI001F2D19C6|nr:SRPBCC family protein [Streptomyces sp. STD 3.1]